MQRPAIPLQAVLLPVVIALVIPIGARCQSASVVTITPEIPASGGVSVGPDGAAYVADFGPNLSDNGGNTIYRVTADGSYASFATGFVGASGNAFDSDGNLYQSNIGGGYISKVTPDGTVTTFASTGISAPVGVAVDQAGNVYNTNCVTPGYITRTTPQGVTTVFASSSLMSCPNGLTIDNDGNLYAANFNDGRVVKITPDGTVSTVIVVNLSAGNGHLTFANDRLYVCNWSGRVYEVTLDRRAQVLAGTGSLGTKDGPADEATFYRPNGISATVTGDTLFINQSTQVVGGAQLHPNVVRMITGVLSTVTSTNDEVGDDKFGLLPNVPNPFIERTTLRYSLPEPAEVSLEIVDLLGRSVRTLVSSFQTAGIHEVEWQAGSHDGGRVAPGVYLARLRAGRRVDSTSIVAL